MEMGKAVLYVLLFLYVRSVRVSLRRGAAHLRGVCASRPLRGKAFYLRLSVGLCLNKLYTFRNDKKWLLPSPHQVLPSLLLE